MRLECPRFDARGAKHKKPITADDDSHIDVRQRTKALDTREHTRAA